MTLCINFMTVLYHISIVLNKKTALWVSQAKWCTNLSASLGTRRGGDDCNRPVASSPIVWGSPATQRDSDTGRSPPPPVTVRSSHGPITLGEAFNIRCQRILASLKFTLSYRGGPMKKNAGKMRSNILGLRKIAGLSLQWSGNGQKKITPQTKAKYSRKNKSPIMAQFQ